MVKSISEILRELNNTRAKGDKIRFMQAYKNNKAFMTILKYAFDPKIEFLLPEEDPPYTPATEPDMEPRLYNEARKLYTFTKRGAPNLSQKRREAIFVQVLENVDKEDAKLLLCVKNKQLPYKNLTPELVEEAFPGFLDS